MESIWSGTAENSFFNGDIFDRNRKLQSPEYEYSGKSGAKAYYILSVDVGRIGCDSVVCVFKVNPQPQGVSVKSLVNIYTMNSEHFGYQSKFIKKLYFKYKARAIVIDANGLGLGLMDDMVLPQKDYETGIDYPGFGVINDNAGIYKKFRTEDTVQSAIYMIKANVPINTEAHVNAQTQMSSGKVKFLIDEKMAQVKLLNTGKGTKMTHEERSEYLQPFTLTSILKEEMLNLKEDREGVNIILKQANKSIRKDKFSSSIK